MTCCKSIHPTSCTIDQTTNQQRVTIQTDDGDIDFIFNIYEYFFFYLTIHIHINYLNYNPTRFRIFNCVEGYFENTIGDGFLLCKDLPYEIYDNNQLILSLNPSTTLMIQ